MAINDKVYIGSVETPAFVFSDMQIERINFSNGVDLINDELSADTLECDLFYDDTNDRLKSLSYATPLFYYSENRLVSKYYISRVARTGVKKYRIYSTSLIGLIEKEIFYGGFYTGERFQDVLNDILFTNGVDMSKYNIYAGCTRKTSGNYEAWPSKLIAADASQVQWRYRIHAEFTVSGAYWGSSGTSTSFSRYVAGCLNSVGGGYWVQVNANRADTSSPAYWHVRIWYNNFQQYIGYSTPLYGDGTRFTVDINPLTGKSYLKAEYVKYDDPSVTGVEEVEGSFTLAIGGNIDLGFAFGAVRMHVGPASPQSNYGVIFWKQQVYDETGKMILDALYAVDSSTDTAYIVNACDGTAVENQWYQPSGDVVSVVSSFDRFERDVELSHSLLYAENVADLPVRGWIKVKSRREALHELLFAENVNMLKTENGEYLFTTLSKDSSGEILEGTIYDNSVEEVLTGAKKISVTEHSYETAGVTSEKIFDNSSSAAVEGEYLVKFDKAPIFGTPVGNGITIKKFNCNVAIVEGRGTITGTPYNHSQSVIQYTSGLTDGTDVSVSDIGIITSANSDNVMNKLKAYYSGNLKKISNDIVYKGQRCGLIYDFKSLFRASNSGYLRKISAIVSSFVKAVCEFITGYVPPASGGYVNFLVRTYDESWTVPSSVRSREYPNIRVNIIGKGHDGTSGANGTSGEIIQQGSGAKPGAAGGKGGAAGTGGTGGNIYLVTIDVSNVAKIEVSNSNYDTIVKTYNDNNVLLNTYSSASGNALDNGFTNIFDGTVYARKGLDGVAGADGGKGGSFSSSNHQYVAPENGGAVGSYAGGTAPSGITLSEVTIGGTSYMYNSFGGGGGAAYGANGGNAREQWRLDATVHTQGGAGATALPTAGTYTEYGSGGFGGNGGGGGGGGAARYSDFAASTGRQYNSYPEDPGAGGAGSAGTPGIDGCVVIYY